MSEIKQVTTPLTDEQIHQLKAGDSVHITGVIYTARDKAHRLLVETLDREEKLPVDLTGQIIYYVGPAPAKPGQPIGSCGPTTSGRMDAYAPRLIEEGLKGMIGKGPRNQTVIDSMIKHNVVYLAAVGGAGVLLSNSVKKAEAVAYPELATCAIHRLDVVDLPCIVAIDAEGNSLYELGIKQYSQV